MKENNQDREGQEEIERLKKSTYSLVQWPDSQEFMEEEWFYEEAILNPKNSGYFIPTHRLYE